MGARFLSGGPGKREGISCSGAEMWTFFTRSGMTVCADLLSTVALFPWGGGFEGAGAPKKKGGLRGSLVGGGPGSLGGGSELGGVSERWAGGPKVSGSAAGRPNGRG